MREGHGVDEELLEAGFDRRLDLLHLADDPLDLGPGIGIQKGNARARSGGVAGAGHPFKIAVRDQPQHHGVFDVDMAAEGTGQGDAVELGHLQPLHQQLDAGIERRLGKLDGPDIVLGHGDRGPVVAGRPQYVGEGPAGGDYPVGLVGHGAVDDAVRGQEPGQEHLRHRLDDPGAADAGHPGGPDRLVETGIVGPQIAADHPEARLLGLGIDPDPFDGAGRGRAGHFRSARPRKPARSGWNRPAADAGCPARSPHWCRYRPPAASRRTGAAPPTG